jgi:AraC-like DNA-binding protein
MGPLRCSCSVDSVYIATMRADVSVVADYLLHRTPPTLHMLLCCYCLLQRWDHSGLSSPYWRWYWNDRRGASVSCGNQRIELGPRHIVLIPPHTSFSTRADNPVGHLYCHFWLGMPLSKDETRPVSVEIDSATRSKLRVITKAFEQQRPVSCPPSVWFSIHSMLCHTLERAPFEWERGETDVVIDRVRHRLHDAPLTTRLDNASLAKDAGLSVNTLLRRFRNATGTSPQRFLIQLRVERAAEMLRQTTLSIESIAEQCGFVDRYHLSRIFKGHAGMGPATYRRNTRNGLPPAAA